MRAGRNAAMLCPPATHLPFVTIQDGLTHRHVEARI